MDFLEDPAADIVEVDDRAAEYDADIYRDRRRAGTPAPNNDMWIAATAAAGGMTVLTIDDLLEASPGSTP